MAKRVRAGGANTAQFSRGYAPEMEGRLRWYWMRPSMWRNWRVDETYGRMKGKWVYLYRAVTKLGDTIDFFLSPVRNVKAAKRFSGQGAYRLDGWEKPHQFRRQPVVLSY